MRTVVRRISLLIGVALIAIGIGMVAYDFLLQDDPAVEAPTQVTGLPAPALEETPPPTPEVPTATPSMAPVVRFEAPAIGIDAPVETLGLLAGGVMESPHGPINVGWYSFSAQPGTEGNAVFAGHVDYVRHGAAVFYRLRELKPGDEVRVTLEDGASYVYQVVWSEVYNADDAPVAEIVGPTPGQTITLITCTGVFDRNVLEYDKRLIVRAERRSVALAE